MTEEKQKTKDRLLDAAESLFASKGFDEVSIRELAAEAGVNVAAVNYHFQGKENLFQQVIIRRFVDQRDNTLNALDAILNDSTTQPDLALVIKTLVEQFLKSALSTTGAGSFMHLMFKEMQSQQSHGTKTFFKEMVIPVFRAYSIALMDVRPSLNQEQINWIMGSVIGQIHHFIMRWHKKSALTSDSAEIGMMVSMFPALGLSAEGYIDEVTKHITVFSTAAIDSLYPEVSK